MTRCAVVAVGWSGRPRPLLQPKSIYSTASIKLSFVMIGGTAPLILSS